MLRTLLLAIVVALVGCASPTSEALVLRGSGSYLPACPPAGDPTPDGYPISPANTTCYLKPNSSYYWNFPGTTKILYPGDVTNYELDFDSTNVGGTSAVNANSGELFKSTYWPFGTTWQQYHNAANFYWATAAGTLTTASFKNITSGVDYYSFSTLSFSNNDTIRILAPPSAHYTYWPANETEYLQFTQTGVTFNLDPGANFYGFNGVFDIGGNAGGSAGSDTSVIGDAGTPALIQGVVRARTGAQNILLQNLSISGWGGSTGCNTFSCVGAGGGDQLVTMENVTVEAGGPGDTFHNIYLSALGDTLADNSCFFLNNVTSVNVIGQGWTLKLRGCVGGGSGSSDIGTVNHSVIGCSSTDCVQNGTIDFPCGGNWRVSNTTLELGPGAQGFSATYYVGKYGEEIDHSPNDECPDLTSSVNTINLDNVIAIFDGSCCAGLGNPVLICTQLDAANCGHTTTPSCTISNTVLVGNGTNQLIRGLACSDGGGNRSYISRAAAASGEGWSGDDAWGNPCCAFPWLPAHP